MKEDQRSNRYCSYEQIPLLLDANDIVKVLGLSRSNVYEMMRIESFPALVIGGRKMVRKEKLFAWLENREGASFDKNTLNLISTSSTF
jgi:predicted DNA-binding transcriptional regulator AlpA